MESVQELRERCVTGFSWADNVLLGTWPPGPDVPPFRPPLEASITLRQLCASIQKEWHQVEAMGDPLGLEMAPDYDKQFTHHGIN